LLDKPREDRETPRTDASPEGTVELNTESQSSKERLPLEELKIVDAGDF
jgi:hypothetical protein